MSILVSSLHLREKFGRSGLTSFLMRPRLFWSQPLSLPRPRNLGLALSPGALPMNKAGTSLSFIFILRFKKKRMNIMDVGEGTRLLSCDWLTAGADRIRSSRELKKKKKYIFVHLYRSCYTRESQRSRKLQQEATSTQKHTCVCTTHTEAMQGDSFDYGIVAISIPRPHTPGKKILKKLPF